MKATGIIRRIDDLGRVVIPREIRRTLHIKEGDPLEIFTGEGGVIFRKYNPTCDVKRKPGMMAKVKELEALLKAEQEDFDKGE